MEIQDCLSLWNVTGTSEIHRPEGLTAVNVISRKAPVKFGETHEDAVEPLDRWYRIAKRAEWENFAELRADFGSADLVGEYTVFIIGGNKFRPLAAIYYQDRVLLVRGVYTHREYHDLDL
jgi:mRNA interferase HigB